MKNPIGIKSLKNEKVKHLLKIKKSKKERKFAREVLIEGEKFIQELDILQSIKALYMTESFFNKKRELYKESNIYVVTPAIMQQLSNYEHPPGIIALIHMPKLSSIDPVGSLLILDRVQDPGNLGTLLRSAVALNWKNIFIIEACVDLFNDKSINASKGACFKIKVQFGTEEDVITWLKENKYEVLVADIKGTCISTFNRYDKRPYALIVGNEGQGVSHALKKLGQPLSIPINKEVESLNVATAGAILMYALNRI